MLGVIYVQVTIWDGISPFTREYLNNLEVKTITRKKGVTENKNMIKLMFGKLS
jgi:hypothetical protein